MLVSQLAVTCVALSSDDCTVFSGSKDNSVIRCVYFMFNQLDNCMRYCNLEVNLRWDSETGAKTIIKHKWSRKTHRDTQSHEGEVLSVAISSDMRYLASGGRDNLIRIYDTRLSGDCSEVQSFCGHRDAVTSLTFQKDTYSLFSGSADR